MPRTVTEYDDAELGLAVGWDEHLDPNIRKEIREARVTRAELTRANGELASLKRADAFRRAGVPDDKRGDVFIRTYEGSEDPAAIKAAFDDLFGSAPEGEGSADDLEAQRRIAQAGGDAGGNPPGPIDLKDAIRNAKDAEEVKAIIQAASEMPNWQSADEGYRIRLPQD